MSRSPFADLPVRAAPPVPGRAASLSQQVVQGVTERIHSGALQPGEKVPTEPALMAQFGVSRSVVREAVSRLQAAGLVRTRQGVGSFVLARLPEQPLIQAPEALKLRQKLNMLELRLSIEADAAALAAQRRTPVQLASMTRALQDYERELAAGGGSTESDFRFHELIALATGNEYFAHVLRSLAGATIPRVLGAAAVRPQSAKAPRFGEPSPQLRPNKELTAQEHQSVLDAIRRNDAAGARAAMYLHLNNSRERMRSANH